MIVTELKPRPEREDGDVRISDGGELIEAWTPEISKILALPATEAGRELPDGWTLKDGKRGKMLLPPKERGSGVAYRNTKEGFERDQAGYERHQRFEEERKDRRTALMTAVELNAPLHAAGEPGPWDTSAEAMYEWLRASVEQTEDAEPEGSRVMGKGSDSSGRRIAEVEGTVEDLGQAARESSWTK